MFTKRNSRNFRVQKKEVLEQILIGMGFVLAAITQELINIARVYTEKEQIAFAIFIIGLLCVGLGIAALLIRLVNFSPTESKISSSNPVGDIVARGALGIAMLSFTLEASEEDDINIERLTIIHDGNSIEDIDCIYLTMNGARVSRAVSFDKNFKAILNLISPIPIKAGKKTTFDVNADFSRAASAGGKHSLFIENEHSFVSNALMIGTFPIKGDFFKVGAVTTGLIDVEYIRATGSDVIGSFLISSDLAEDQTFYALTLTKQGNINDYDVRNIRLADTNGNKLTNALPHIENNYATLVFDPPFTQLKGDKKQFVVHANVKSSGNIKMFFEENSDLFAVGSLYGYGVGGQLYGSSVRTNGIPLTASF